MSSNKRNTKRENKKKKPRSPSIEEEVKEEISHEQFDEDRGGNRALRKKVQSQEHSSIIDNNDHSEEAPHPNFMIFEGDDANSTIYHVPSFLLKTYDIVDVSTIHSHYRNRTRSTMRLLHGLPTESHLSSRDRMIFRRPFYLGSSSTTISPLS